MMPKKTHLDLFSGIGGFALAASWAGYETVQFCEIDPFCRRVLAKNFPGVPIHDDIRTLTADLVPGGIDLLTGGFPCQPHSVAGKRLGAADDRHLWPEMARVIAEVRPRWVLGENVAGLIPLALDDCLSDLESLGYEAWAVVLPACAVNAWHRRDRVWILAHHADASRQRIDGQGQARHRGAELTNGARWSSEPPVGRVVHGIPGRVDRLRGLGNAIVPQVAYEIIRLMD
jgi:DNA (cytosine-5)-methyltransferase 1